MFLCGPSPMFFSKMSGKVSHVHILYLSAADLCAWYFQAHAFLMESSLFLLLIYSWGKSPLFRLNNIILLVSTLRWSQTKIMCFTSRRRLTPQLSVHEDREGINRINICGAESRVDPFRIVARNRYCILSILRGWKKRQEKNNTQIKAVCQLNA